MREQSVTLIMLLLSGENVEIGLREAAKMYHSCSFFHDEFII